MATPKVKILYVITKSNWGGAQRYVFDLATNLPKDTFEPIVVTGGDGALAEKLKRSEIKVITLPTLQKNNNFLSVVFSPLNIGAFFQLVAIFCKERPDVVHLNSSKIGGLGAVAAFVSKLITKNYKLKTIFTVHGWGFHEGRPYWQKVFIVFSSRLAALFQHHIIHISKKDLAATHSYGIIPQERAEYIPLGIYQEPMSSPVGSRSFFCKKIGIKKDGLWVGTIAELTKNKGLNYLVDAVNQIKFKIQNSKFKIVIIGEGEERENLQNQIRALGLENTVHLAGFVPEAARYLKAFDVFVLPSLKEGLPYTILEAMHAGLPIVATSVGGIPDVIEHKKNGILVPPGNPTLLADAITTVFADANLQKTMVGNAVKNRGRSSLSDMVRKTNSLYLIT